MFTGPTTLCLFSGEPPALCDSPDRGRLLACVTAIGNVYEGVCLETGKMGHFRLCGVLDGSNGERRCHVQGTAGLHGDMKFPREAVIVGEQIRMTLTVSESRFVATELPRATVVRIPFNSIAPPRVSGRLFPDTIKQLWNSDGNPDSIGRSQLDAICEDHDKYFWPHKNGCPMCGQDAYVGFSHVECSNSGCQNWFHREGM